MEINYKYSPRHAEADPDNFPCLFDYCRLYWDDCLRDPDLFIGVMDCSYCDYSHKAGNYIANLLSRRQKNDPVCKRYSCA